MRIEPQINVDGSIDLPGSAANPAFLLIHGFATSPLDLLPIAEALCARGYACRSPALAGHAADQATLDDRRYEDWRLQMEAEYDALAEIHNTVYVIGFSIGGLLALDLISSRDVRGITVISPFLGSRLPRVLRWLFRLLAFVGDFRVPRIPQTTKRRTRRALYGTRRLAVRSMLRIDRMAHHFPPLAGRCGPILVLHSMNDRVSSYKAAARYWTRCSGEAAVVTLVGLNHFLQFDIPPPRVCDVILNHMEVEPSNTPYSEAEGLTRLGQCQEELRHWASILFRLTIGFFTVFGALLFFSLEDVIDGTRLAPVYLTGYALLLGLYLQLFALYFFYVVRIDVYTKCVVEPMIRTTGLTWTRFRTGIHQSGKLSTLMTRVSGLALGLLPVATGLGIIAYVAIEYWSNGDAAVGLERLTFENSLFLQTTGGAAVVVFLAGGVSLFSVLFYSNAHLYVRVPLSIPSGEAARVVDRLYDSVDPGVVTQTITPDDYEAAIKNA